MTALDSAWADTLATAKLRSIDLRGVARAVLLAAHPDDETLGAGGLAQRLHANGAEVSLVVATDGEAAFPRSGAQQRRQLAAVRRHELRESLTAQGLDIEPVWLGLPDSGLHRCPERLTDALAELLEGSDFCLAPWPGDPHPDHRETGLAMLRAAPRTAQCWSYPIWLWHQRDPADRALPWDRGFFHELTDQEHAAKTLAIATFTSQTHRGPHGEDPILPPEVLAHFGGRREVFFHEPSRRTVSRPRFDTLYEQSADPWQVRSRWYERRKRAVALAALPHERYEFAIESACGNGTFTQELAPRCGRLRAFDPVHAAVESARLATAKLPNVEVDLGELPGALGGEGADLVVHAEILYYLDDKELAETIERTATALRPGGHLLSVHWTPWASDAPRDGPDAHRRLLAHPAFDSLVRHDDQEFVVHVLQRR